MQIKLTKIYVFALLSLSLVGVYFLWPQLKADLRNKFSSLQSDWREITWSFPVDAWPAGRAFHCNSLKCGSDIDLYVRPKIGFCDCYRGVADDDEIDRVGDLVMISEHYAPTSPGIAVSISGMSGRARHFSILAPQRAAFDVIGIALARRCDSIVATAVSNQQITASAQDRIIELLGSIEIKNWIETFPQSSL